MNRSENGSPVRHSTLVGNISPKCLSRSTGNDEKHKFWCKLKGPKAQQNRRPTLRNGSGGFLVVPQSCSFQHNINFNENSFSFFSNSTPFKALNLN